MVAHSSVPALDSPHGWRNEAAAHGSAQSDLTEATAHACTEVRTATAPEALLLTSCQCGSFSPSVTLWDVPRTLPVLCL